MILATLATADARAHQPSKTRPSCGARPVPCQEKTSPQGAAGTQHFPS